MTLDLNNLILLIAALGSMVVAIWTSRSKASQSAIDDLAKVVGTLQTTIKGLETTIHNQQETIDAQSQENKMLRMRVKELEHKNELSEAATICLEDKVNVLERDKQQQQSKIQLLEIDKSILSSKVDALTEDNAVLRGRLAELEKGANEGKAGVN